MVLCLTGLRLVPFGGENPVFADESPKKELAVDPTGRGDGYSAVLYDNTNGLPTSEANAIVETEEGFIWIGSYSGLIRYDGNTFLRVASGSNLASVVSLFVDSQNRLWVGTNDSGAGVMVQGEFTMFNKADGLCSLSVRSIAEDSAGNIYLATTSGMVVVDSDLSSVSAIDNPLINAEYICMLRVSGNTIYGVTKNGAVFTVRNKKLTSFSTPAQLGIPDVRAIYPDPDNAGFVYLGSQSAELYYGELTDGFQIAEKIDISPLGYINAIARVNQTVWVCTDTGIGFVTEDGAFVPISNVPMTTAVEGMMTDYQMNLWFVSSQQGVMKIVPDQFTDIFEKYRLKDEVVYSTCLVDDKLFIGTKNEGLIVLDVAEEQRLLSLPIESSVSAGGEVYEDETDLIALMANKRIRSIIRDSKDRLWFSTFSELGLLRYDDGKVTKFTGSDGLPSDRVRAVFECEDGTFLAACTGGLAVIRGDEVARVYSESDGIINTEVLTVTEGTQGEIIVGTDGGGIYVISGGSVTHIGTDDGLSSDVVMRIKKDVGREIYWIITSNSLSYMDAQHNVTTVSNFPYSNNFDLYENSRSEMWVLSSSGIYVADADQLIKNEEISYLFYGRDNVCPASQPRTPTASSPNPATSTWQAQPVSRGSTSSSPPRMSTTSRLRCRSSRQTAFCSSPMRTAASQFPLRQRS